MPGPAPRRGRVALTGTARQDLQRQLIYAPAAAWDLLVTTTRVVLIADMALRSYPRSEIVAVGADTGFIVTLTVYGDLISLFSQSKRDAAAVRSSLGPPARPSRNDISD